MTHFHTNRIGLDEVTIELSQSGKSETEVNLRHTLLDDTLDYVFSVDHLQIPLNDCPLFVLTEELFRIERRNVGANMSTDLSVLYDAGGDISQAVYFPQSKFYDISAFVEDLNNFCRGFERAYTLRGIAADNMQLHGLDVGYAAAIIDANIAPLNLRVFAALDEEDIADEGYYPFLSFQLKPDGTLKLNASSDFWNHFYFNFTRTGAELLGYSQRIKTFTHVSGAVPPVTTIKHILTYTVTDPADPSSLTNELNVGAVPGMLQEDGTIEYGRVSSDISVFSEHSLHQSADNRLKITLETDLPMKSNVQVIDNTETVDRSIAEVYFTKDTKSILTYTPDGRLLSSGIQNNVYAGDYQFIKKSDRFKSFTKLLTSYELRLLRFYLKIWYRAYDSSTDKWKLLKKELPIAEDRMWNVLLRFVSEI